MKIGILSDIHGNHYALMEVLKEAENIGIEHLLILGDIVGYYYHPDKVLDLLSTRQYDLIKGNHEDILFDIIDDSNLLEKVSKKYGRGHEMAIEKLSESSLHMLRKSPSKKEIKIEDVSFLMCHGSPWLENLYIYPDADNELLSGFNKYDYDFVLFGHTHYPCIFRTKHGVVINPGSIGQSREKGGVASWAIVNTMNNIVQFKSTPYDTKALEKEVLSIDPEISYNLSILSR